MNPANGLHSTISREEYDAIERERFSRLKLMAKSPAHYRANVRGDTDSMRLGRAAHLAVLEPAKYKAEVAVWTGGRRQGKAWDAFEADNPGKEPLTKEEDEQTRALADAVHTHPDARKYLNAGTPETTVLWEAEGHSLKGRLDFDGELAIVDLKSTTVAASADFGVQMHKLGSLAQAALYSDGYELATGIRKRYVLIAVEKMRPFVTQVYRVTEAQIDKGRAQYTEWLSRLAYCRKQNYWPGYFEGETDLVLPAWAERAG